LKLLLIIKQGDTRFGVHALLKDKDSSSVNLTDCYVHFHMSNGVNGAAQVINPLEGEVIFPLEYSATNKIGNYRAEFKVTYKDGRTETFPNDSYIKISIMAKVGD
jgi:hypothetical protein